MKKVKRKQQNFPSTTTEDGTQRYCAAAAGRNLDHFKNQPDRNRSDWFLLRLLSFLTLWQTENR